MNFASLIDTSAEFANAHADSGIATHMENFVIRSVQWPIFNAFCGQIEWTERFRITIERFQSWAIEESCEIDSA